MGHQMVLSNERLQLPHYIPDSWRCGQHLVRDSSVPFNKAGYSHVRIHETLEPVHDLIAGNKDCSHFNGSVSISRREPGCFKVNYYRSEISHESQCPVNFVNMVDPLQ